jgi:D-glycero-D-manno-heptose 1,7-bisphosphate phosphatase
MERTGEIKGEDKVKKPAVFMDRDGTINEQMGYINHQSRFKILKRVPEAIRLLNDNEFLTIMVSNQSGVARDYFPIDLVYDVHSYLEKELQEKGAYMDGIFFCPHYPSGKIKKYSSECDCRKPKTGMLDQAQAAFDIDMSRSYVVGDRYTDMEFAEKAGLKGILVKTGYGMGDIEYVMPQKDVKPAYIAEDLFDGAQWIINNIRL